MKGSGCTFRVPRTVPGAREAFLYSPTKYFKSPGSTWLVPAACSASPGSTQNHSCE